MSKYHVNVQYLKDYMSKNQMNIEAISSVTGIKPVVLLWLFSKFTKGTLRETTIEKLDKLDAFKIGEFRMKKVQSKPTIADETRDEIKEKFDFDADTGCEEMSINALAQYLKRNVRSVRCAAVKMLAQEGSVKFDEATDRVILPDRRLTVRCVFDDGVPIVNLEPDKQEPNNQEPDKKITLQMSVDEAKKLIESLKHLLDEATK